MLEELKQRVLEANLMLPKYHLVTFTWGNVSGIDRDTNLVVIKPSGVSYETMKRDDMVVCDLDGNVIEGNLKPSSDLMTHLEIYKHFPNVGGVVHTHSQEAVAWAQAGKDIPNLGTTHADYFYGPIPCTRPLEDHEIISDYELNTGKVIVETFETREINPDYVPGVVVFSHGPFAWGTDPKDAVHNAVVLEEVATMDRKTISIKSDVEHMQDTLLQKHFLRKHGPGAYYGQK